MLLKSISLTNFRNFKKAGFKFSPKATLIVGPNTSGKSNILEAVYLLASGGSLRARYDRELIGHGETMARVFGEILPQAKKLEVAIIADKGFTNLSRKRFKVNGVGRKLSDFAGNFPAVLFSPEDLNLVTDSPRLRRRYLDFVLCQVERDYRRTILKYDKARRQRNRLLCQIRDGIASGAELDFWDREILHLGPVVTSFRKNFFSLVNKHLREKGEGLRGLFIDYHFSILTYQRLEKYQSREIAVGMTLIGPHREDFRFIRIDANGGRISANKGRDLGVFGSRGEQRLAILHLKLAELEFIASKVGERPVLLLDDIFSELDENNRRRIFKILDRQQTILTTTDLKNVKKEVLEKMEVISL